MFICPYLLKSRYPEIKIVKIRQLEGQMVFVFENCFHSGFNESFNVASAINISTKG